jgi:hypothetical protein
VFPHARQAIQITRKTRRLNSKKWTTEVAYAITSLTTEQATATELATWLRGHWAIENRLRWVRDVIYDEDRSQIRIPTGPRAMASSGTSPSASCASTAPPTSSKPSDITHGTHSGPPNYC